MSTRPRVGHETVAFTCSECPTATTHKRTGRPRKTCSEACSRKRQLRRWRETLAAQHAESARWWLSLSEEQRLAAMAFVRRDPRPAHFSKYDWAYVNRAAFSCEGTVVAGVF